jgi:hypothetical protein
VNFQKRNKDREREEREKMGGNKRVCEFEMAVKSTQHKRNVVAEYANDKGKQNEKFKKKKKNLISFDGWARWRWWCFN